VRQEINPNMFAYAHRCVFRALADFFAMIRTPRYKRLIGTVVGHNDHFDRLRYNHFRLSYQTSTVQYVVLPFVAQTIWIRSNSSVSVGECIVRARDPPMSHGEYELRLRCGKEYTVTRTYNKNLRSLAEFWIGTGTFKARCRFIVSCSFELK
ncbi:MAG TPA: hypothetical protein VGY91_14740, partial [Chthoniobacterales bacterium]|nr:hypothetical protein [Chthoniobacterales bacterium]